jgi:hypothetical protein
MDIVTLLFLLVALLMIVGAFWSGNNSVPFVFTVSRAIGLVVGLIILYVIYVIVGRILVAV